VGSKRRLWILEKEMDTMIVTSGSGKKYETEVTGWVRRFVRGEEVYTKTMADGTPVLLSRIEAGQRGVVMERHVEDNTLALPSAGPTSQTKQSNGTTGKAREVDLTSWADELSKGVSRFAEKRAKQNELRRQHVAKYKK
jgi:hypothetical protein